MLVSSGRRCSPSQSENVILLILLVFGSAATFMFWTKWLGKILAIANNDAQDVELTVYRSEWASLGLMTVLTVGCCIGFPLISVSVVAPYLQTMFGVASNAIPLGDLWIMAVIALVIAVIFLGFTATPRSASPRSTFSGVGVDESARTFRNSFNGVSAATQRNWYMGDIFGERKMVLIGITVSLTPYLRLVCLRHAIGGGREGHVGWHAAAYDSYEDSLWE